MYNNNNNNDNNNSVLWHRTPEVKALGRHLWEAKRNPSEVQCQSSPKQSMQFVLVTLYSVLITM